MFKGTLTAIADALSATYGVVRPRTATPSTEGRTMQRLTIVSRELTSLDRADEDAVPEFDAQEQPWLRHRERC
jgi:hypothetical protein